MEITRPTLLLNKETAICNIETMALKAANLNLNFRPHFKTHQSAEIGEWFRAAGVKGITVSSFTMANYFAEAGWDDITIAFSVNILEIPEINELAGRVKLNLLIENMEGLEALQKQITWHTGIFIKIDTGYNRTGIESNRTLLIDQLLEVIQKSPLLQFKGFLAHTGHTYQSNSTHDVFSRHFDALLKMKALKARYVNEWPELLISLGDTPSCSICENFDGVDEIRPGNFVFYDLMQFKIGVCKLSDIAIRMVCPVIATHPSRNEVVIYGGAIHFAKDSIINIDGKPLFGRIIINDGEKSLLLDERNYLHSLSQEHGILKITPRDFQYFKPGNLIEIIPVHACLTANLMKEFLTTEGEIIKMMPFY
ncbi:MAG TPA: alanine racemase [Prolixibacteraceae bacterium]|nr:alanine racemase [Prolixibacteraceae bacterium]